ncbi:MAG: ATP-binding protein, partial [Sandarakinorhabdus sp.]|nr:ATP-binding protein [Sandarakinorhabdus sp.]
MTSPFKFLDSYTIADSKVFFGRDAEIDALYKLVFQTRLLLVYGQSGTGKTSIIQCGLANRFKDTDWFPVFVRRNGDINTAFDREIRRLAPTPIKAGAGIVKSINSLYLDCLRPITIIFDQFEELFILGLADEQALFFNNIKAILASDLNCKIIISMREEYIAQLQGFEKVVPSLFDKRLRIEQMTPANVEAVITGTVADAGITLEDGSATAQRIIDSINDRHTGVQLSYLQVYLDRLYRDAARTATPLLFTNALIEQAGALGDVMAVFLDEQSDAIEADLGKRHPDLPKDAIQQILEQMVTIDGTKLPIPRGQLAARLPSLAPVLNEALAALEASRIVRDVDSTYELAHDALAQRIADRRSADRKAMLRIESLVKERLAASSETKTFLSREELALVRPAAGALQLSQAEADFVHQSDARLRRRRLLAVGGTAAVIAALAGFGTWARIEQKRAYAAIGLACATTDNLSFTIVDTLRTIPKTQDIRRQLLLQVAKVNRQLGNGTGDNRNASFWQQILE